MTIWYAQMQRIVKDPLGNFEADPVLDFVARFLAASQTNCTGKPRYLYYCKYTDAFRQGLRQPPTDPLHHLVHLRGRASVAETDEVFAADRVEIDTGGGRYVGLRQHAGRELVAVGTEARYVGVE